MKNAIATLLLFSTAIMHARCVLQLSIPKSGTHALKKCIDLILENKESSFSKLGFGQQEKFKQTPKQFRSMLGNLSRVSTHLTYQNEFEAILEDEDCDAVLCIRHPLDVLVSLAHHINKRRQHFPYAAGLNLEQIIDDILDEGHVCYHSSKLYVLGGGFRESYEQYLSWINAPGVLTIKFEDLVGPLGGGTLEDQKRTIRRIAEHLGVTLSQARVDYICENLFGGTRTFRKGRVGSYKEELSPDQLKKALALMQPSIAQLGYEL